VNLRELNSKKMNIFHKHINIFNMFIYYLFLVCTIMVSGAIIQAPDNIICFIERDFCTIENFVDKTGQSLLVEVVRSGAIVGSAVGIVSGDIDAFEINHPGGYCWGDGTNLKVTPDIQAGDLVTIKSGALLLGEMTILNGYITTYNKIGTTLTIKGFVETSVNGNIELRIVNPLLLGTTVAKRQVNAIFGPLVPNVGYSSSLEIVGTTFTATFIFDTQSAADIASSGEGYSLSLWQETAPNGARQGLTISEYGEVGGPFSNLCPAGPQNLEAPVVNALAVSGNIIKWSPGQDINGAAATSGFSVSVMRGNKVYGYRLNTVNQVVFDLIPLAANDIIELRSMIGTKMSKPLTMTYTPQILNPTISSLPIGNAIKQVKTELIILTSNTNQIVYTLDGSSVLDANGKISTNAILYYTPIPVTKAITLKAVAFDRSGKIGSVLVGLFAPPTIVLPKPVTTAPTTIVENGGVKLSWIKPDDSSINGFGVDTFTTNGVKVGVTRKVLSTTLIIKDLVPGTSYQFTVTSQNAGGSSIPSPKSVVIVFPSPTDTVTITSARYIANKEFKITGTGSAVATVTLYSTNADGTIGTIRGTTTPISAPVVCAAGVCDFKIDIRNTAVPITNPERIYIKSSLGGVSGPFVI
jgi:hypothetical protein